MREVIQSTVEERREDVTQTIASWVIEGFEPDFNFKVLLNAYIAGEITTAEIRASINKEFIPSASKIR